MSKVAESDSEPESRPEFSEDQPWLGLVPYGEEDRERFFGRDDEIRELLRLVRRDALTVVFGRSGTGKSSLLSAGLFPQLRKEHFLPIPLRIEHSGDVEPRQQIREALSEAMSSHRVEPSELNAPLDGDRADEETVWEYLHRFEFWEGATPIIPVLVFDQFEEVFTHGGHRPDTEQFKEELADLVENYLPAPLRRRMDESDLVPPRYYNQRHYKIIITLREDFVSRLDELREEMPSIMHNRFSLEPMNGEQALDVILKPGAHLVEESVAREIVKFVADSGKDDREAEGDGEKKFEDLPVEPALLSLVCRELNTRRIKAEEPKITRKQVTRSKADILYDFFVRSFEKISPQCRMFVEDRLVTASGFRRFVPVEDALESGLAKEEIAALVDRRLIRKEDLRGTPHLELTHDVLTGVVQKSRDARRERERREKERERLEEERRAREAQLRRTRKIVLVLASATAAFLGLAIFAGRQWYKAEEQEKKAKRQARINLAQRLVSDADLRLSRGEFDLPMLWNASAYHAHALNVQNNEVASVYHAALRNPQLPWATYHHGDGFQDDVRELLAVAWSPSGGVSFAGKSGAVRSWNWRTGEVSPVFGLDGENSEPIHSLAWTSSSTGPILACGRSNGGVEIRDGTGRQLDSCNHNDSTVNAVAWNPTGMMLASAGDDGSILIWESQGGGWNGDVEKLHTIRGEDEVRALAWNRKGEHSYLASGDLTGDVTIWNPEADGEGKLVEKWPYRGEDESEDAVHDVAWSGDGTRLASVHASGDIWIWDWKTERKEGENPRRISGGEGSAAQAVRAVAWFETEGVSYLATTEDDRTIRIWHGRTSQPLRVFQGHEEDIWDLAWNEDGTFLASVDLNGAVRIWDLEDRSGTEGMVKAAWDSAKSAVWLDHERARVAWADRAGNLHLQEWDAKNGQGDVGRATQQSDDGPVYGLAVSGDGTRVVWGHKNGNLRLWDWKASEEKNLGGPVDHENLTCIAWRGDRHEVASGNQKGAIKIWSVEAGEEIEELGFESGSWVSDCAWNRTGTRLATAHKRDGLIRVWDYAEGESRQAVKQFPHKEVRCIAWSEDGHYLASGSDPLLDDKHGTIRIWDLSANGVKGRIKELVHGDKEGVGVQSIAWNGDGSRVASAHDEDNTVQIWDPRKGAGNDAVFSLEGHTGPISALAWNRQGTRLVSASGDKTVRIWSFDEKIWLRWARRKVGKSLTRQEWESYIGGQYAYPDSFPGGEER